MANFRDFVFSISPPWLRRYWGERFVGLTMGLLPDLISEAAGQAIKSSWLLSDTSPPDALPDIGTERSMPRYYFDTDATYRARLHGAWDAWKFAGNEEGTGGLGIVGQYNASGLPNVIVVPASNQDERAERHSWRFEEPAIQVISGTFTFLNDDGGSGNSSIEGPAGTWADITQGVKAKVLVRGTALNNGYWGTVTMDTTKMWFTGTVLQDEGPLACTVDATWWSRFAVVIEQTHSWVPLLCGAGVVGDLDTSPTCGSTAVLGEVRSACAIARKWGPGHAINPYIYVILSGEYVNDPARAVGDAGYVVGGSAIKWANQ